MDSLNSSANDWFVITVSHLIGHAQRGELSTCGNRKTNFFKQI